MTDREKLVELFELAQKNKNFQHGNHVSLTDKVMFYVDKTSYESESKLGEKFFSFTAFGFEVRNTNDDGLMVDGKMKSFSEFNFQSWYVRVKDQLVNELTMITLNGKKYKLVEETKPDEELPF